MRLSQSQLPVGQCVSDRRSSTNGAIAVLDISTNLIMSPRQVMDFIRHHGVVLQSAKGLEPSLAARIAGGPIHGSWWSHPRGREIFALIQHVHASNAVLVCSLAGGKITYIHRRLWPFFLRTADKFPDRALDMIQEVHLSSGRHRRQDIPFPDWVPAPVVESAKRIPARDAIAEIQIWLHRYGVT